MQVSSLPCTPVAERTAQTDRPDTQRPQNSVYQDQATRRTRASKFDRLPPAVLCPSWDHKDRGWSCRTRSRPSLGMKRSSRGSATGTSEKCKCKRRAAGRVRARALRAGVASDEGASCYYKQYSSTSTCSIRHPTPFPFDLEGTAIPTPSCTRSRRPVSTPARSTRSSSTR